MISRLYGWSANSFSASVGRQLVAHERLVGLDDLAHLGLDRGEVVVAERLAAGQLEVVVEAVLDRRADRELGAGEQLRDGLGHDVRRRVAQHVAAFFAVAGDDRHRRRRRAAARPRSHSSPLTIGRDRGLGKPRADRLRHGRSRWRPRQGSVANRREG